MYVDDCRYLIIGGAPKAGTTSIFNWLADHPDTCAASQKETRFFLDPNYPLPGATRFTGDNLDDYETYFLNCQSDRNLLRIDATPDYLYSKNALKIASLLPHAKIVFILRDPVERMVSWYKYARQRGFFSNSVSFEEYVSQQLGEAVKDDTPTYLRALEQCCYQKYLPAFQAAFGDRCMTIDFNELAGNPQRTMGAISEFAGVRQEFFDSYEFTARNVSQGRRRGWIARSHAAVSRTLRHALHRNPTATKALRIPNKLINRVLTWGLTPAGDIDVTPELSRIISSEIEKRLTQTLRSSNQDGISRP